MADATRGLVEALQDGLISRRTFVEGALRLGLSASAAGALLAACGSGGTSTSTSSSTSSRRLSGDITIFVGFGTGNQPSQVPVQQALADAFMRQNPDVRITFTRIPSDARTKFTLLLSGGTPPDVVMPIGLYGVSLFVDQNVWLDLRPYVQRDGVPESSFSSTTVPATHVTNYYGSASQAVIGIPVGVHDHALAYNVDAFKKAGVQEPPTSWTDSSWSLQGGFLQAARALTLDSRGRHAGQSGFDASSITQFGTGHFFREAVYYDFGGHLYDATSRKAQLGSAEAIAGIQFAADLVNKEHVQPSQTQVAALGGGASSSDAEAAAWRAGKLAMIDMCSCDIRGQYGTDVPFTWKAAAMPAGPKRRFCFLNLDVATIPSAGKNHDVAWEVVKFFAVDPANERQLSYRSYGAVPPLSANQDAFPSGIRKDLPNVDPTIWIDGFSSASPENEAWFPAFAQVNDLIGKTFDQIVGGQATAAAAMPRLQADAQAQIDKWFSSHTLPTP